MPPKSDKKLTRLQRLHTAAYAANDFEQALKAAEDSQKLSKNPRIVFSQALCLQRLGRSAEGYARISKVPAPRDDTNYFDLMAELTSSLGKIDELKYYGACALSLRDAQVAANPRYPIPVKKTTDDIVKKKVIAFSLYGGDSKYCEPAILNCHNAAKLFPDWQCRFYYDETVPKDVQTRILAAGGELVMLDEATRQAIHPRMWRFLVADDSDVSHFLCRDADSLIREREAAAVNAWLQSGAFFHVMRDSYTHTELMLAGLWGGKTGIIPDMRSEIIDFVATDQFDLSHIDQFFLRKRIWPTARQSVLSHDRLFQFFNNEPFPEVPGASLAIESHIGATHCTCIIRQRSELPDLAIARVSILDEHGRPVCDYNAQVINQRWQLAVPVNYADMIENRLWSVKVN